MKVISHIKGDDDILEAWIMHYLSLGVKSFHLIVHGRDEENRRLILLKDKYPIVFEDRYYGEFSIDEKERRVNDLLKKYKEEWLILVDSDEFIELPYPSLSTTIRILTVCGANALYAPMLQRLAVGGTLNTPAEIVKPFNMFPLCSTDVHKLIGLSICISKYPLFYCSEYTWVNGGYHGVPNGLNTVLMGMKGVTHHFKWRQPVLDRLRTRAYSAHKWRAESLHYLDYLVKHGNRMPVDGSFSYSRATLFKKHLLVKANMMIMLKTLVRYRLLKKTTQ